MAKNTGMLAAHYRTQAAELIEIARRANSDLVKAEYLRLAIEYERMAAEAARSDDSEQ